MQFRQYYERVTANIKAHPVKWIGGVLVVIAEKLAEHRALAWANDRIDEGARYMMPYIRDMLAASIAHPLLSVFVVLASYSVVMVAIAHVSALLHSPAQDTTNSTSLESPGTDNSQENRNIIMEDDPQQKDRSVNIGDRNTLTNSPIVTGDGNTINLRQQRTISEEQKRKIISLLSPFKGTKVLIEAAAGWEADQFATELSRALEEAGLIVATDLGLVAIGGGFPDGVSVEFENKDLAFVSALAQSLVETGLIQGKMAAKRMPQRQLTVLVGARQ